MAECLDTPSLETSLLSERCASLSAFGRVHSARIAYFLRRLLGRPSLAIDEVATAREVLSPQAEEAHRPPRMPHAHWKRILHSWNGGPPDEVRQSLRTPRRTHAATVAYTLSDVVLVGQRLMSGRAYMDLCRGTLPGLWDVADLDHVTLASTWTGTKWFGHFIHDELPLQLLTCDDPACVAHARPVYRDEAAYRALFKVPAPRILPAFHARQCRVIVDFAQNESKRARYAQMRENAPKARGKRERVYLQRAGGEQRGLTQEARLMETLAAHGFVILNNGVDSVERIAEVCSRAEQIVTLDGSHAAPVLLLARPGTEVVLISPPHRVSEVLLDVGEAAGLRMALFVAEESRQPGLCSVNEAELLAFVEA